MKTKQNKLGTYLAVTAGVGCAASSAYGATTVTIYSDTSAYDTNPVHPELSIGPGGVDRSYLVNDYGTAIHFGSDGSGGRFTDGTTDLTVSPGYDTKGQFGYTSFDFGNSFQGGAQVGSDNYILMSLNGNDGVYESVGQFNFTGFSSGYLVAIATNDDGSALSITQGSSAIAASSVPEPSSLALLALGSAGLIARRRRKN